MKVKQFIKEFSGAAIDSEELADLAIEHLEEEDIGKAARQYMDAKDQFFALLEAVGYEHG
jgi:hypothetical protein